MDNTYSDGAVDKGLSCGKCRHVTKAAEPGFTVRDSYSVGAAVMGMSCGGYSRVTNLSIP